MSFRLNFSGPPLENSIGQYYNVFMVSIGLPVFTNKNIGFSVKFEFLINNEFFSYWYMIETSQNTG